MQLPYPEDAFLLGYLLEVNRDSDGWPRFMLALQEHFNLRGCHLIVINPNTHAMRFHIDSGERITDELASAYLERYLELDEVLNLVKISPIGQFYASNMLPKELNYYQCDYYLNWSKPQGIHDVSAARLYRDGNWDCIMSNNRRKDQGPYSQEELNRLSALTPFIGKSIQSSFLLSEKSKDERRAKAIANTYRIPVAVLTEYGEVWTTNSAMDKLVADVNPLSIKGKCLHLEDLSADKRLATGIIQAAQKANGINMSIESSEVISIDDNITLAFQELIDTQDDQTTFLGVLVYALSKDMLTPIPEDKLMKIFSLTRSEARVCHLLIAGNSLKDMTLTESKSVHTVREQLNNAFRKTGCTSQVSLVNLLASIPV
ncbi:MAG: helix-turn-helix transcriptional regulator [Oleispira sp.]